jgi:hypothetical protein
MPVATAVKNEKKPWTTPVLRRLEGVEAERARKIIAASQTQCDPDKSGTEG